MGDSLPRTPMNHCAIFDAARFILAAEIRNCKNKHTQKTNKESLDHSITELYENTTGLFRKK